MTGKISIFLSYIDQTTYYLHKNKAISFRNDTYTKKINQLVCYYINYL